MSLAHPTDSRLSYNVTGKATVPVNLLKSRLGDGAFLVWQVLTKPMYRRSDGWTRIGIEQIAKAPGFTPTNYHSVRRYLRRLIQAGLVVNESSKRRRGLLPYGDGQIEAWMFPRYVYGCFARTFGVEDPIVLVPGRTKEWLENGTAKTGWGGKRTGSGRKKSPGSVVKIPEPSPGSVGDVFHIPGERFLEAQNSISRLPQPAQNVESRLTLPAPNEIKTNATESKSSVTPVLLQGQAPSIASGCPYGPSLVRASHSLRKDALKPEPLSASLSHDLEKPGDPLLANLTNASGKPPEDPPKPDPKPTKVPGFADRVTVSSLGTKLRGSTGLRRPPPPGHGGVPPFPTAALIKPAVTPAPAKLPADGDLKDACRLLAKLYRDGISSRYKVSCFVTKDPSKGKTGTLLRTAAQVFIANGIAPAAWVAWSIDTWRASDRPVQPSLKWVYSEKRLEERIEWFLHEVDGYKGGRVVLSRSAQNLMRRYYAMKMSLVSARAQTPEEVAVVVNRYFPNGLYDRMVKEAREAGERDQKQLRDSLAAGEWLGW